MTWFRVDDKFHDHPKVRRLRADKLPATGLWSLAGAWAADNLTDGFVPAEIVQRFDPKERYARRLVEADLWIPAEHDGEPGYRFHEWTDYQPTRESIEDRRAVRAAAGRLGGLRSGQSRRSTGSKPEASASTKPEASAEASAEALLEPRPVPTQPNPEPTSKPSEADASGAAAPGEDPQPALMLVSSSEPIPGPITARDVTAAWVNACRANHAEPTGRQKAQVGKTAKELLAKNDPQRVLAAASAAGAKGYESIDRELTAIAGRSNSRSNGHIPFKSPPPDEYVVGGLI